MNSSGDADQSWVPRVRLGWLIVLAFAIQLFTIPAITDPSALMIKRAVLTVTALLLLPGILLNLKWWAFRVLALGFVLNTLVMTVNGGLMPVTPENYLKVAGPQARSLQIGQTPPHTKSLLMAAEDTRLGVLSDTIILTIPTPRAYSPGDFLLLAGLLVLIVEAGGRALQWRSRMGLVKSVTEEMQSG